MAKLIELQEAAKILGISPEELTELRSRNQIFGYRDGSTWKFKVEELERVKAERPSAAGEFAASDAVGGELDELVDVDKLALDDDDDDMDIDLDLGRSDDLAVDLEAAHQEKELRVQRPALHIAVKVGEIRVLFGRLEERLHRELGAQPIDEARLSGPDGAGDGDDARGLLLLAHANVLARPIRVAQAAAIDI